MYRDSHGFIYKLAKLRSLAKGFNLLSVGLLGPKELPKTKEICWPDMKISGKHNIYQVIQEVTKRYPRSLEVMFTTFARYTIQKRSPAELPGT